MECYQRSLEKISVGLPYRLAGVLATFLLLISIASTVQSQLIFSNSFEDPIAIEPSLEQCLDGIDNDLNGLIDAGDPSCAPGCDLDMDGFPSLVCGGADFNDNDSSTNPGAKEVCGDFADNDQDGLVDEGCVNTGIAFGPDDVTMVSGEKRVFTVIDSAIRVINWQFKVNGVKGGSTTTGTLVAVPNNGAHATYTAPTVSKTTNFTLSATHPGIPGLTDNTTVTVLPLLNSNTIVTPNDPTIGLGRNRQFLAKLTTGGSGSSPLHNVFWKVNGVFGGTAKTGKIDADGIYHAPPLMPAPLPIQIRVGFSFSKNAPVIASTPVLLAQLDIAPNAFRSAFEGPIGQIASTLTTSDNIQVIPAPASLQYISPDVLIASAGATGNITIGPNTGRSFITVIDPHSGAFDEVMVESLPQVDLTADAVPLHDKYVRIKKDSLGGATEIEFTRPFTQFQYRPRFRFLRGQNKDQELSGLTSEHVTISADGINIIAYDPANGVPQASGVVATLNIVSGIVDIGDVPGSGTITTTYDDGYVTQTHTLEVSFTRLTMVVDVSGVASKGTTEVFNTEYINVDVSLSNPGSSFVGLTPILLEVENEQGQKFRIGYQTNPVTGTGEQLRFSSQLHTNSIVGNSVVLGAPSSLMEESPGFRLRPAITFRVQPGDAGVHTIRVTINNDKVVTQEVDLTVKRTEFEIEQCQYSGFSGTDGTGVQITVDENGDPYERQDGAPLVIGSWVPMDHKFSSTVIGTEHEGPAVWRFLRNGVEQFSFPASRRQTSPFRDFPVLSQAGMFQVVAGPKNAPSLQSEPYDLNSVTAASVADLAVDPMNAVGTTIPRDWQFGSIEVVSAETDGNWTDLKPVHVVLQTYNANGEPTTIGYKTWAMVDDGNGGLVREDFQSFAYGVFVRDARISGPFVTGCCSSRAFPADGSGRIEFDIIPKVSDTWRDNPARFATELRKPFILKIHPYLGGGIEYAGQPEIQVAADAFSTKDSLLAQFSVDHAKNFEAYSRHCIYFGGNGLAIYPEEIPVPSQRIHDAVAMGDIPADAAKSIFTVYSPGIDFAAAVASGIASADLGDGMSLESSFPLADGRLELTTLATVGTTLGFRNIKLVFNDGNEWNGNIRMVQAWLEKSESRLDKNMPLNAVPENQRLPGILPFNVNFGDQPFGTATGTSVSGVEIAVTPSIATGDIFRAVKADQPLVGLTREHNADSDDLTISTTKARLYEVGTLLLFGNTLDRRTLTGVTLGDRGHPDGLPDFVSHAADAEVVTAKLAGNWADIQRFTAYNIFAEEQAIPDGAVPELDFDILKSGAPNDAYANYSTHQPSAPNSTWNDSSSQLQNPIAVFVDHEARTFGGLNRPDDFLDGIIPLNYWGGVLDQYYQLMTENNYTRMPQFAIGQDGRVGAYDGEFGGVVTGVNRQRFGVELDGVFYENDLLGFQEQPNSPRLRSIPIINTGPNSTFVTAQGLLRDAGGTSAGHFDFEQGEDIPRGHTAISKTPGQRAPGLVGGYLIQDTPSDFKSASGLFVENDAFRITLERSYTPSFADTKGPPLAKENAETFGTGELKRLMSFSSDLDRKDPLTTASKVLHQFSITTDPPGLPPVRIKSVVDVSEVDSKANATRLFVTTQSDGSEAVQKVFLDTGTDLATELVGGLILSVVSAGGYLEACAPGVAGELLGESMDILSGTVDVAFSDDGVLANKVGPVDADSYHKTWIFAYDALKGGVEVPYIESTGIQFDLGDVVTNTLATATEEIVDPGKPLSLPKVKYVGFERAKLVSAGKGMALCKLARAPITATKKAIKEFTSIERLGGKWCSRGPGHQVHRGFDTERGPIAE